MDEGIPDRLKRLRAFGLLLGALLAFFSWRWGRKGWAVASWTLVAGAFSAAIAIARPALLDGFERRWMSAARVLARINTFLILAALYHLVLVPYAYLLRLFSADPLDRAWEDASSYWRKVKTGEDLKSYERQF